MIHFQNSNALEEALMNKKKKKLYLALHEYFMACILDALYMK